MTTTQANTSKITVDFDVIQLAAELVLSKTQDEHYWKTVPVPLDPNRAMPGEAVQRAAVFAPMLFVLAALVLFGAKVAGLTFLVAFPLMALLHHAVTRAVRDHLAAAAKQDAGRFAAVDYLSKKMGLAPKEVTWGVVHELYLIYAQAWLKINDQHKAAKAAEAEAAAARAAKAQRARRPRAASASRVAAGVVGAVGAGAAAVAFADELGQQDATGIKFNPMNGQAMANDMLDMHGNLYGSTLADDLQDDGHQDASYDGGGGDDFTSASMPVFDMAAPDPFAM